MVKNGQENQKALKREAGIELVEVNRQRIHLGYITYFAIDQFLAGSLIVCYINEQVTQTPTFSQMIHANTITV